MPAIGQPKPVETAVEDSIRIVDFSVSNEMNEVSGHSASLIRRTESSLGALTPQRSRQRTNRLLDCDPSNTD